MKLRSFTPFILLLLFVITGGRAWAQADLCSGVGAAQTLTVASGTCSPVAYTVPSTFGTEMADPSCAVVGRDGWFRFTTLATQNFVTIVATTNRNAAIVVYSGACGSLVEEGCRNAGGGSVTEVLNMAVTPSTTYYIRLVRQNTTLNNMTGNICVYAPQVITTCSATFTDGAGNYLDNANTTVTYCPSTAGQCIRAVFSAFSTESGLDLMTIHNGNNTLAPQFSGSPFSGTTLPGTITGTTASVNGCLTFNFSSDVSINSTGWSAAISCATCDIPPPSVAQDCNGGTSVCSDAAFSGNSSGAGNVTDLTNANDGCLSGESQSSWYYFSPSASGVVSLNITPTNPSDDYDFAIWGPMATFTCPPVGAPIRCSYAAVSGTGVTGLNASATPQTSEGAGGDGFVDVLTVTTGQKYIMVINNFSSSSTPFAFDWTTSGGASLNCAPLPVQLVDFSAVATGNKVKIDWHTISETRNDYFTLEKSNDGTNFFPIEIIQGAGTVSEARNYETYDLNPTSGTNYYRLTQTDYDGRSISFEIVPVSLTGLHQDIPIEVFPVPTSGFVNVRFKENLSGETDIHVTDVTGRTLLSMSMDVNNGMVQQVDVSSLSKGIYFVSAQNEMLNKKSVLRKIIID